MLRIYRKALTEDRSRLPVTAACITTTDKQEIIRRRVFQVSAMEQVFEIMEALKEEKFQGRVCFNVGRGGVPQSVEAEERAKL